MIAHFYLLDRSFRYPKDLTIKVLEERIKLLSIDVEYIRKHKETNKIYRHSNIYAEEIYTNISLNQFLYQRAWKGLFNRDTFQYLQKIIDRAENTNSEAEEIVELFEEHSEREIFGLLCLHKIEDIKEDYLVYDKHNWLTFRRKFLTLYPQNDIFFFDECTKYFPDLYFHPIIKKYLGDVLPLFKDKVVFHLSCLNDEFHKYKNTPYQRIETLKMFSSGCNLDEVASPEGDINKKKRLNFQFENDKGRTETICCEPHLKLCHSDAYPGDSKYYYKRIYFHEGKSNIQNGKILVAHIGNHL